MAATKRTIPCPMCEASVTADCPTFPFCSPRCRALDLGNWLDERYQLDSDAPSGDVPESLH